MLLKSNSEYKISKIRAHFSRIQFQQRNRFLQIGYIDDSDFFLMLVTIPNQSPTSQSRQQHQPSPTQITNIDVAQKSHDPLKNREQPTEHLI